LEALRDIPWGDTGSSTGVALAIVRANGKGWEAHSPRKIGDDGDFGDHGDLVDYSDLGDLGDIGDGG